MVIVLINIDIIDNIHHYHWKIEFLILKKCKFFPVMGTDSEQIQ